MNDMNTNFVGPINVTNAVLPSMRERRDGTIVFVGSRSAYRTSIPVCPPPPLLHSVVVSLRSGRL